MRCELLDMIHDNLTTPFKPLDKQSTYGGASGSEGSQQRMVERSFDFLYKRNLSTGSFLQLIAANWAVDKEREEVREMERLDASQHEIIERLLSLYLGYPLPYAEAERPLHLAHLSPDAVIRTLGTFRAELKVAAKAAAEGTEPENITGGMSWFEAMAFSSPIAHAFWCMAVQDNGAERQQAFQLLARLVHCMCDPSLRVDFNRELIRLVGDRRYSHLDPTREIRQKIQVLEVNLGVLRSALDWLSGYLRFLRKHGDKLGGFLWHGDENGIFHGRQIFFASNRRAAPKSPGRNEAGR